MSSAAALPLSCQLLSSKEVWQLGISSSFMAEEGHVGLTLCKIQVRASVEGECDVFQDCLQDVLTMS